MPDTISGGLEPGVHGVVQTPHCPCPDNHRALVENFSLPSKSSSFFFTHHPLSFSILLFLNFIYMIKSLFALHFFSWEKHLGSQGECKQVPSPNRYKHRLRALQHQRRRACLGVVTGVGTGSPMCVLEGDIMVARSENQIPPPLTEQSAARHAAHWPNTAFSLEVFKVHPRQVPIHDRMKRWLAKPGHWCHWMLLTMSKRHRIRHQIR